MHVILAFINGLIIGTSRAINGRLSGVQGPFYASMWNHAVAWLFLTCPILFLGHWKYIATTSSPTFAYFGGVFGALYVAVQSSVFGRLGATNTTIAVINGQMLSALLIDQAYGGSVSFPQIAGVALILLGVYLTRR